MINIFYGEDSFRIGQRASELRDSFIEKAYNAIDLNKLRMSQGINISPMDSSRTQLHADSSH